MNGVNYAPVIDEMTWSYSRIKTFDDCPYKWYLTYIMEFSGRDMFFSGFGSLMHELIEKFYKEGKSAEYLALEYLSRFYDDVPRNAPSVKVFENYFTDGLRYLRGIQRVPYEVIGVEEKIEFEISGKKFVGILDLIAKDDSGVLIIDNKSRKLKPRSKKRVPTKSDLELDDYLRQLYLYSVGLRASHGLETTSLCFNCFRENLFIKEKFHQEACDEAVNWALEKIEQIRKTEDFKPRRDFFKCRYLCEMNEHCEYYQINNT